VQADASVRTETESVHGVDNRNRNDRTPDPDFWRE